ncbi:MAG: TonB C-terminal domain-containing protein [Desulfobulbaceae bacterium]|uniref:TonB C-terminal domain-containing protein n=1 Tax=Candidatus Desulfobia pelagia TaxID=2841692 RepID=A0A8J6TGE8_9BACT|nr:TonB C-terminal domain-containing protein [Candidatus Desulfobia pelagia]
MATGMGANQTINIVFQKIMDDKQLKLPLFLAIMIHIVALGIGSLPASLFQRNLNLEEIYTVDLFDINEPVVKIEPAAPALAPATETPPAPVKEAAAEPVISLAQEPSKPAAPAEIISLHPRKMKKNIHLEKEKIIQAEEIRVTSAIEKLKKQKAREDAEKKAVEARASADAAARKAVDLLRASIRTSSPPTPSATGSGTAAHSGARRSGGGIQVDAALKQYYISVSQKIHDHWILPEMQKWDENLEAIMVVHVRRDGIVTKKEFEKKSPNLFFNQFVDKTLRESLPLPPFPPDLKENELEIGLVFHPAGLM